MIVFEGEDRLMMGGYTVESFIFFFLSVSDPISRTLRRYAYRIKL